MPYIILSIAGSDSSGGAGIQADIKTISALGGYAASVITAVTAQNTIGVQSVYPIPADVVRAQVVSVMDDLRPNGVKIGMIHDAETAHVIAECLRKYRPAYVVYDPVMASTGGKSLMTEQAIQVIMKELLPLCTLITPNLHEAGLLFGHSISATDGMKQAARELSYRFRTSVLIKGGHLQGDEMCDVLYERKLSNSVDTTSSSGCVLYSGPKIESRNLHGTGCTLSSAITLFLAGGYRLDEAVCRGKNYISQAITRGKEMKIGQGSGPLWHFPLSE
ncbi:bifunctional hydroxymethylpyrimidine kinase/phosphomethylpyrimidine kinase [Bacteroides zoogleoformans]|uniref:bifunctional hydroxymethylpyrimidine kinase/phosphomethylpyrimidine kinase n=1 Tax=Bacteroides zoogleoformans TaxID=28119 RepID=UPI00248DF14C|nr:bifunctional hydroxymethylpyrimidine kinase/phosphomethylpyrimidine kinase [Bacteroides zoogleoformans]